MGVSVKDSFKTTFEPFHLHLHLGQNIHFLQKMNYIFVPKFFFLQKCFAKIFTKKLFAFLNFVSAAAEAEAGRFCWLATWEGSKYLSLFLKNGPIPASFLFIFVFSTFNNFNKLMRVGLEHGAAELKVQTNPLRYGGFPYTSLCLPQLILL